MIIGICGTNCAGKDSVAKYLKNCGFKHISLSKELMKALKKEKIKLKTKDRAKLIKEVKQLRKRYGPDFLVKNIEEKINKPKKNFIVSSIRNVYELLRLYKRYDFLLVSVDAPLEQRYERCKKRDKKEITLKEFLDYEKQENGKEKYSEHLEFIINIADIKIFNDKSLKYLKDLSENIYIFLNDFMDDKVRKRRRKLKEIKEFIRKLR